MSRDIKISIVEAALPEAGRGITVEKADGEYIVILRASMTDDEKAASFLHEMLHIYHDDFNSDMNVNKIETLRHAETGRLLKILQTS